MADGLGVERRESADNKRDILTKPMDQHTETRHLMTLRFYYSLEWINMEKETESDVGSGTLLAAIGRGLAESVAGIMRHGV